MSKNSLSEYHNIGQADGAKGESRSTVLCSSEERAAYKEGWSHGKGQHDYNKGNWYSGACHDNKGAYNAGWNSASSGGSGK